MINASSQDTRSEGWYLCKTEMDLQLLHNNTLQSGEIVVYYDFMFEYYCCMFIVYSNHCVHVVHFIEEHVMVLLTMKAGNLSGWNISEFAFLNNTDLYTGPQNDQRLFYCYPPTKQQQMSRSEHIHARKKHQPSNTRHFHFKKHYFCEPNCLFAQNNYTVFPSNSFYRWAEVSTNQQQFPLLLPGEQWNCKICHITSDPNKKRWETVRKMLSATMPCYTQNNKRDLNHLKYNYIPLVSRSKCITFSINWTLRLACSMNHKCDPGPQNLS